MTLTTRMEEKLGNRLSTLVKESKRLSDLPEPDLKEVKRILMADMVYSEMNGILPIVYTYESQKKQLFKDSPVEEAEYNNKIKTPKERLREDLNISFYSSAIQTKGEDISAVMDNARARAQRLKQDITKVQAKAFYASTQYKENELYKFVDWDDKSKSLDKYAPIEDLDSPQDRQRFYKDPSTESIEDKLKRMNERIRRIYGNSSPEEEAVKERAQEEINTREERELEEERQNRYPEIDMGLEKELFL